MQLKNQLRKEETDEPHSKPRPGGFQGGFGSSSLKECIELLNATANVIPLLHSTLGSVKRLPIRHRILMGEQSAPPRVEVDGRITAEPENSEIPSGVLLGLHGT